MAKLREIHQAYKTGAKGEQLPADAEKKPSRIARLAHQMGASSFSRQEKMIAAYEQMDQAQVTAEFEEALSKAEGYNKDILLILKEAARIPREHNKTPLRGFIDKPADGSVAQKRTLDLRSGTVVDDKDLAVIEGLGTFTYKRQGTGSTQEDATVPIDHVSLTSSAHKDKEGNVTGVTSTLFLNDSTYNPNLPVEKSDRLKGSVKIGVDQSGNITEFGLERANQYGLTMEDPTNMQNFAELLEKIRASVVQTADAWEEVETR